jgi:hypothetical protein
MLLVSAVVLAAVFVLVLSSKTEANWTVQVVDEKAIRQGLSLALDSNNNPQMCYVTALNGRYFSDVPAIPKKLNPQYLTFASWNGATWNFQTVDSGDPEVDWSGYVTSSALAIDSDDNPHIVYTVVDDSNGTTRHFLKYASRPEYKWVIQNVDDGAAGSIALDSAGNPHLAYAGAEGRLKYASWNGQNWAKQVVDSESRALQDSQYLALDSNDTAFIVYNVGASAKLAMVNSSRISQTAVSNVSALGNVVLDSAGYPHFTYSWGDALRYNSWDGSEWKAQVVVAAPFLSGSCVALDSAGRPHITYIGTYSLKYTAWMGSGWAAQTVLRDIIIDPAPLALDSNGNPHIGYLVPRMEHNYYSSGTITYTYTTDKLQAPTSLILGAILLALAVTVIAIAVFAFKRGHARKAIDNARE